GVHDEAESEKVKAVANVSNVCLLHGQLQAAGGLEEVTNLVTETLGILLRASCDKDTPIVRVACEPHVRFAGEITSLADVAVHALFVKEPVQLVQDRIGQ